MSVTVDMSDRLLVSILWVILSQASLHLTLSTTFVGLFAVFRWSLMDVFSSPRRVCTTWRKTVLGWPVQCTLALTWQEFPRKLVGRQRSKRGRKNSSDWEKYGGLECPHGYLSWTSLTLGFFTTVLCENWVFTCHTLPLHKSGILLEDFFNTWDLI